MSTINRGDKIKAYLTGGILGAVAMAILGFSMGWVVSAGSRDAAVANARIETYAAICEDSALANWTAQGGTLAGLDGYENNDTRRDLATTATEALAVSPDLQREVVNACEDLIDA